MQGIRYGCKYIIKFKVGGNILRVENLHEGQIIKNYKELCKILEIEEKPGKSRQLQHNHFNQYFEYKKEGHKYIINKIYKNVENKIKRGGNNRLFVDDFRNLIISILHNNRSETMLISKGMLYKTMNLVNENYLLGRNNMTKLSEITEIPQTSIYDFYDYNSVKLKDTVERNLKHCRNRSLLIYENVMCVAIQEALIAYNELDKPILDEHGRVVSESRLTYREATKQEKQVILKYEKEVKNENGWKDNQEIFLKGKWKYFKQQVENKLIQANTNIKFYYEAYRITWNNKDIDEEYKKSCSEISSIEIKNNINHNMVESIKKSTMKRHNKACLESGLELNHFKQDKLFQQEKIDYVIEQEQLTMTLINKDAPSLKKQFKIHKTLKNNSYNDIDF